MNTFLSWLKKFPWYVWVMVILGILVVVEMATGAMGSRKLYNMALDQLRQDQTAVVETLQANQKMYEEEISKLNDQLEAVKKKQIAAQNESARLRGLVREKDAQILALKKERETIVVPTDPNLLVDEFRKLGYGSARVRKNR